MANRNQLGVSAWLTTVLALTWLLLVTPFEAWSQPPIPGTSPTQSLPAVASPTSGLKTTQPIIVRGPCDPDYWIVSTRCCKAQVECCQPCNYQVYRFDGPSPARGANLNELYASLQPGVPVCFMAHGSYVEWNSMLQDCAQTYRWLRQAAPHQPLHIIFFTWPSDDSTRLVQTFDVNKLGRRAELNGLYLAQLVAGVPEGHPISLLGHSHGARMVSATAHVMAGGEIDGRCFAKGPDYRHRLRIVLAAAAIDHDWFNPGGHLDRTLCRSEAVLNLRNRHDFPLLFYPTRRLFSSRALAITGVTRGDRWRLGDQNCRIDDCDITPLVGLGHVWGHYYCQPDIAAAIRHFIYFDEGQ